MTEEKTTHSKEDEEPKNKADKPPAKYTSMKDTLQRVTVELETTTMQDTNEGQYHPTVSTNPHHDSSEKSGEGKG